MDDGLIVLLVAVAAFVGSHFVLSHPLRARLVGALGTVGFQLLYGLASIALLLVVLVAYHVAPVGPRLWSSDNLVLQLLFDVAGYFSVVLFMASLWDNPSLVGANLNGLSTRLPIGIYRVTRHPMMFAIAIWSVLQMTIMPSARNVISCTGFVILALVGSKLQDKKKIALSGREWGLWTNRTPFWPNLRLVGEIGPFWLYALLPWLLATWLEVRITTVPVGLWYFFPDLPY